LLNIRNKNKEFLKNFDFISGLDLTTSVENYGAPQVILDNIDKDINVITYTELLCYFGSKIHNVKYLEFGCSFGKNLVQVMNHLDGTFTTCDLEHINPNLGAVEISSNEWTSSDTTKQVYKIEEEYFKKYTLNNKEINYGRGNVFSPEIYQHFPDTVNIVFSDALHDPRALQFEIDNLLANDLLEKEFFIYYDDLHGQAMINAFGSCFNKLNNFSDKFVNSRIFYCHGWIGEHEFAHTNGIITNMGFDLEWEKYVN